MAAAVLPPLLPTPSFPVSRTECRRPGRASASRSWIQDKLGGLNEEEKVPVPGRASSSRSWVEDKAAASAGNGRIGRAPSVAWSVSKRAASRAPSADRTEKKQKAEAAPATAIVIEAEAAPAPKVCPAGHQGEEEEGAFGLWWLASLHC